MKNRKIKSLMALHGITGVSIAKQLGISRNTVYVVVGGYRKSRRVQEAIAKAVKTPYEDLWGEKAA